MDSKTWTILCASFSAENMDSGKKKQGKEQVTKRLKS